MRYKIVRRQIAPTQGDTGVASAPISSVLSGGSNLRDAAEIARRAYNRVMTFQMFPTLSVSDMQFQIDALRAINPDIILLGYMNVSEVQSTSSAGVWGAFWTLIDDMNWWGRTSYPSGTINSIQFNQINLASPRTGTGLYTGLTSGEAFVDKHFESLNTIYQMLDGVLLDNMNFVWPNSFDYNENGATEVNTTAAMRNAMIAAWQKVYNRILFHMPGKRVWCNPRIAGNFMTGQGDDRTAFKNMHFDGFLNQNAGPGLWTNGEGIWAHDTSSTTDLTRGREYPGPDVDVTAYVHGDLYRNKFGAFKKPSIPDANPGLYDFANELHNFGYVNNTQNIIQEVHGYTETEELVNGTRTTAAQKQQHNRVNLGYWWVMSDISPMLLGLDTNTGRMVVLDVQQYNWGNWLDPPGVIAGPYASSGGHNIYVRRSTTGCMILNPRYDPDSAVAAQPASLTITTPTPPAGKTWTTWTGGAVGGTIVVPTRSCVFLKAA